MRVVAQQAVGHGAEPEVALAVLHALRGDIDASADARVKVLLADGQTPYLARLAVDDHNRLIEGADQDVAIAERGDAGNEGKGLGEDLSDGRGAIWTNGRHVVAGRGDPYRTTAVFTEVHRQIYGERLLHVQLLPIEAATAHTAHRARPHRSVAGNEHTINIVFVAVGRRIVGLQPHEAVGLSVINAETGFHCGDPQMMTVVGGNGFDVLPAQGPDQVGVGVEHVLVFVNHLETLSVGPKPEVAARVGVDLRHIEVGSLEGKAVVGLVDEALLPAVVEPQSMAQGVEEQPALAHRVNEAHHVVADGGVSKRFGQGDIASAVGVEKAQTVEAAQPEPVTVQEKAAGGRGRGCGEHGTEGRQRIGRQPVALAYP